jgi:hypothetical protein
LRCIINRVEQGAVTLSVPADVPDWNAISRDILCPLCDYNLRGLVEPRCPECGHQFFWSEALSQGDRIHPFLFEHQPHRNIWSLTRTIWACLFPTSFWKSVLPIQNPVPSRLMLLWRASIFPGVICAGCMIYLMFRQVWVTYTYSNAQAWRVFRWQVIHYDQRMHLDILPMLMAALLWPWLTLLSLLVFRWSMNKAHIRSSHILRCVIYTQLPLLMLMPAALVVVWFRSPHRWTSEWRYYVFPPPETVVATIVFIVLSVRMVIAYRSYLRFPHALATVVASQVMVAMMIALIFINMPHAF